MLEFTHGGQVEAFAKKIGCKVDEVIDLSSNINFLKPTINIDFNQLAISSYPTYDKLYDTIATNYNLKTTNIELFNGGSSAIFSLFKHLNLTHCTIYSPAYLEYKKACKIYKYDYTLVNRFDKITQHITPNSFVVFVNPSTPDGQYYDIEELIEYWDSYGCTILIDESFLDFTTYKSAVSLINTYSNLYILKSMTKFYSCAGVRCGTLISNETNIKNISQSEPMWKISQFDSYYLQEALKDTTFKKTTKAITVKNQIMLENILKDSNLFETIYPSNANFILAKLKNITAQQLQQKLIPYKIYIRDCSNFDFLDKYYVRFAVKSEKALEVLSKALLLKN